MNTPRLIVACLGAALVGFAVRTDVRPTDTIDPQLFRASHERWQSLPETERDALRERLRRFRALPPGEQEALDQRSDTLRRLRAQLSQRQGREPTAEESATELARVVEMARQRALRQGVPAATTAELLEHLDSRTRRHIKAFLDNLDRRGRVSPQDLARLRALSPPEQQRVALLLKAEQIHLYAEGVRPDEADALLPLPPLDSLERTDRWRRQRGFLGRLGRWVPLTDEDRSGLEDATDSFEFRERLRERKDQPIRALLAERGVPSERIEALMAGPVNELEREADEVLAASGVADAPVPN